MKNSKNKFNTFVQELEKALKKPLPGREAQLKMVPELRRDEILRFNYAGQARQSAVMILLYEDEGQIKIPLIHRANNGGVHSRQLSFPGGQFEQADNDLKNTALRETSEEIGVCPDSVTLIGSITDLYIPPSNFMVYPFVAYTSKKPEFVPNRDEVDRIMELEIRQLLKPGAIVEKEVMAVGDRSIIAPCFYPDGVIVWGATAMMLCEFLEIVIRNDLMSF